MMVYVAELKLTRILYTLSKGESSMNNVSRRRSLLSVKGYSNLDFPPQGSMWECKTTFGNEPQIKQTNNQKST